MLRILAINTGSSSIKFSLHEGQSKSLHTTLSGLLEGLEPQGSPQLSYTQNGQKHTRTISAHTHSAALAALQALLQELGIGSIDAVAHRIVHGGADFTRSVVLDAAMLSQLEQLNPLAPLHQPHNLAGVRAFAAQYPGVPQVGCFDTAFHATMPPLHRRLPLPQALHAQGVQRYGFHGLSYQYISAALMRACPQAAGKVIMAHLGSGASLCAMQGGHSVDTTMSFSALDGLMMSSRTGSLDAGVLLYLLEQGYTHAQLQKLLYKESGLLGVSASSGDMRTLRAAAQAGDTAAQTAIDLFTHRIAQDCAKLSASLSGLDVIAFSGGIGENDAASRAAVCTQLHYLGIALDEELNTARSSQARAIHAPHSRIQVWVVPTDEGSVAAQAAAELLPARG